MQLQIQTQTQPHIQIQPQIQVQAELQWKRCGEGSNDSWPGWPHSGPIRLFAPMRDQPSLLAPSTSHNNDEDHYHIQIHFRIQIRTQIQT